MLVIFSFVYIDTVISRNDSLGTSVSGPTILFGAIIVTVADLGFIMYARRPIVRKIRT